MRRSRIWISGDFEPSLISHFCLFANLLLSRVLLLTTVRPDTRNTHAPPETGQVEIVKFLLDNGADVNQVNMTRATPLIAASSFGHIDVVKALLEAKVAICSLISSSVSFNVVDFILDVFFDINSRCSTPCLVCLLHTSRQTQVSIRRVSLHSLLRRLADM